MKWEKGECSDGSGGWYTLDFGFGELCVDDYDDYWKAWYEFGRNEDVRSLGEFKTKEAAQRRCIRELKKFVHQVSKLSKQIEAIK